MMYLPVFDTKLLMHCTGELKNIFAQIKVSKVRNTLLIPVGKKIAGTIKVSIHLTVHSI